MNCVINLYQKKLSMHCLFGLSSLLLFALPVHAELLVRFKTPITPQAKRIGDLLVISPDTHRWGSLLLDSHPRNGEQVTQKQVMHWLQKKVGVFPYQWRGKNTALVRISTANTAMALMQKAQLALARELKKHPYHRVELQRKTELKNHTIPLAAVQIKLPQGYPSAKRVCVYLQYKKDSIPVWFAVKAYQSVLVARHKINAHRLIKQEDVMLQERNIAGLNAVPLSKLSQARWLNRSLNKHQILMQSDVHQQPAVKRGQKIKVNVTHHGISITTNALAQSDAEVGQLIRMKNPSTNKYFSATIIGKNQAEITE